MRLSFFSGSTIFSKLNNGFDVVIIDEAAQAIEPATLVPQANGCKQVFLGSDNEESDEDDDTNDTGLAVKIVRQQKYLRATMGGVEDDEMNEEEAREDQVTWSKRKGSFYDADEAASSDEELLQEEEAEVLGLQREKAKSLSIEDFGLEDTSEDESDTEPTLGDIVV